MSEDIYIRYAEALRACNALEAEIVALKQERGEWRPTTEVREAAREITAAFAREPNQSAWGAHSDDGTSFGIEWNFNNGDFLVIDFEADGEEPIFLYWRPNGRE